MQPKQKDAPYPLSSAFGTLSESDADIQRSLEMLRTMKESLFASFQKHSEINGWHYSAENAAGDAMALQGVIKTEAQIKAMLPKTKP